MIASSTISDVKNGHCFLNIKLEGLYRDFETFALSKSEAEILHEELLGRKNVIIEGNILDLQLGWKRKIKSLKLSDEVIYNCKPNLKNNIYMGIGSLIFGCWLFWLRKKK